jgi:hypothetical protein
LLEPSFSTLAVLFVSFVTGGVGLGTFVGKLVAWLFRMDRSLWGDLGGILGGLVGVGLFIGVVIGMVSA